MTGQRVGEVAGIVAAEIDLKAREWRLPGSRTKNGHSHVVPLSDLAIEIIKEATQRRRTNRQRCRFARGKTAPSLSGPLFPCGDGSLSPVAVARTILRANETSKERPLGPLRHCALVGARSAAHGAYRHGAARRRADRLGHVANHRTTTRAGVTLAVYSQYTYDKEKREALDLWAGRIAAIVGPGPQRTCYRSAGRG